MAAITFAFYYRLFVPRILNAKRLRYTATFFSANIHGDLLFRSVVSTRSLHTLHCIIFTNISRVRKRLRIISFRRKSCPLQSIYLTIIFLYERLIRKKKEKKRNLIIKARGSTLNHYITVKFIAKENHQQRIAFSLTLLSYAYNYFSFV